MVTIAKSNSRLTCVAGEISDGYAKFRLFVTRLSECSHIAG